MVMKYPWIAEAITDWKLEHCKHKGNEMFCNNCALEGEICDKLLELSEIITNKIKEED